MSGTLPNCLVDVVIRVCRDAQSSTLHIWKWNVSLDREVDHCSASGVSRRSPTITLPPAAWHCFASSSPMPVFVSLFPRELRAKRVLPDPPPVIRTIFPLMGVGPTGPYCGMLKLEIKGGRLRILRGRKPCPSQRTESKRKQSKIETYPIAFCPNCTWQQRQNEDYRTEQAMQKR
jgi:hypothetical protein